MTKLWCYAWAYVYEVLGLLDRFGDWMVDQIDHNDYLAGFVFAVVLFAIPYIVGIIDIVFLGG